MVRGATAVKVVSLIQQANNQQPENKAAMVKRGVKVVKAAPDLNLMVVPSLIFPLSV